MKNANQMLDFINTKNAVANSEVKAFIDSVIEPEFHKRLSPTITVELAGKICEYANPLISHLKGLGYFCKLDSHRNEVYLKISCNPL